MTTVNYRKPEGSNERTDETAQDPSWKIDRGKTIEEMREQALNLHRKLTGCEPTQEEIESVEQLAQKHSAK